jgi:hypothetical protein
LTRAAREELRTHPDLHDQLARLLATPEPEREAR